MRARRRQRLIFVVVVVSGVALATGLALGAIGQNMLYFYSPSQLHAGEVPTQAAVRIGGLVVKGSVHRGPGLRVDFALTDGAQKVPVTYVGVLPDLFREGQGIVARGRVGPGGVFRADEVLAKHDEKYMPPEVAQALKIAKEGGTMPKPHGGKP